MGGDGPFTTAQRLMASTDGDCDDAEATIHPEALESCDGIDQDCDGFLDNRCGTTHLTDADWTLYQRAIRVRTPTPSCGRFGSHG